MSEFELSLGQKIATHVALAADFLQKATQEPLYGTTKSSVAAFTEAVNQDSFIIPSNDPHNLIGEERSALSTAIGNIYGFSSNELMKIINPHCLAVFEELKKAADIIHHADLCLHT